MTCLASASKANQCASRHSARSDSTYALSVGFPGREKSICTPALNRLGITHRRAAYHHPKGNSYIERFRRSLKEEEVWAAEYRSLQEARDSIARWIAEYNHDRRIAACKIAPRARPSWLLQLT